MSAIFNHATRYYAFELLFWTGIREGELLALTKADFDIEKKMLYIRKSYQRLETCQRQNDLEKF